MTEAELDAGGVFAGFDVVPQPPSLSTAATARATISIAAAAPITVLRATRRRTRPGDSFDVRGAMGGGPVGKLRSTSFSPVRRLGRIGIDFRASDQSTLLSASVI